MTVLEIVEAYLREHNHHGLCRDGCGCSVNDLAHCSDGPMFDCQTAKRYVVKKGDKYDTDPESWAVPGDKIFIPDERGV